MFTCITDRSETARMLLELDDPAPAGVVDHSGQSAIVWMITKMAPVVSQHNVLVGCVKHPIDS